GRGELPGGDQFVEALSGRGPLTLTEPADPSGQPLEGDPFPRHVDPPGQVFVVGEQIEDRPVGTGYVGGIAGQRAPPKRTLALAEQRADVGGHETGKGKGTGEPALTCLVAKRVAVVEDLGAGVLETH